MNIVEVVYNWPAEVFIQRHVEALWASGCTVQVVARTMHNSREIASTSEEKPIVPAKVMPNFNHLSLLNKIWSLRYFTQSTPYRNYKRSLGDRVLIGYFNNLQADVIHFHDVTLAAAMNWIPQVLGVPYTVSLRGSDLQVWPYRSSIQREKILAALRGAVKIHAVCKHLGKVAETLVGRALEVETIYTTVPIPPELPVWSNLPASNDVHFVSSGRVMWRKNFPSLLLAFKELLDRGDCVRLTLVGSGPEMDRILYWRKRLDLEDYVTITGKLNYQQITNLLSQANAYIQASMAEGLSNALVEAMANGLPVFATDVGGTAEVVEDGVTGFLLPPFYPEKWAEILIKIRDIQLMEQVRRTAYQRIRDRFSVEHHTQAFATFYREAISNTKTFPLYGKVKGEDPYLLSPESCLYGTRFKLIRIQGEWCWENRPDELLLSIYRLRIEKNLPLWVQLHGSGPQQDELNYLGWQLGLFLDANQFGQGSEQSPDCVVNLKSETREWIIKFSARDKDASLSAGDVKTLKQLLLLYVIRE